MKDKHLSNGEPDVLYLQDVLDAKFGAGKTKVILPITDPYVVHHGALGSYAVVYLPAGASASEMAARLKAMPGIEAALGRHLTAKQSGMLDDILGRLVEGQRAGRLP